VDEPQPEDEQEQEAGREAGDRERDQAEEERDLAGAIAQLGRDVEHDRDDGGAEEEERTGHVKEEQPVVLVHDTGL